MESIGSLLGRFSPKEPDEIAAIKQYIIDEFDAPSTVAVKDDRIIVSVHSASLATTLRLRMRHVQQTCRTEKKLVFRIGE